MREPIILCKVTPGEVRIEFNGENVCHTHYNGGHERPLDVLILELQLLAGEEKS